MANTRDELTEPNFTLMDLVSQGNANAVAELLKKIPVSDEECDLALRQADKNGNEEVANALIIYRRDEMGDTALHFAAANGELEMAKDLINRGAHIDAQNNNNETPLLAAIKKNQTEVADYFLNRGASLDKTNTQGQNAIILARTLGNPAIVELIYKHILLKSAYLGEINVVSAILNQVMNPDGVNSYGDTALHMAALNCQPQVVQCLLDDGRIDVNRVNNVGQTPLAMAACGEYKGSEQAELVRTLLSAGAQVKALDNVINTISNEIKAVLDEYRPDETLQGDDIPREEMSQEELVLEEGMSLAEQLSVFGIYNPEGTHTTCGFSSPKKYILPPAA